MPRTVCINSKELPRNMQTTRRTRIVKVEVVLEKRWGLRHAKVGGGGELSRGSKFVTKPVSAVVAALCMACPHGPWVSMMRGLNLQEAGRLSLSQLLHGRYSAVMSTRSPSRPPGTCSPLAAVKKGSLGSATRVRALKSARRNVTFASLRNEPRFVHTDRTGTKLGRLGIAADPVEYEVHPVLVVERKA